MTTLNIKNDTDIDFYENINYNIEKVVIVPTKENWDDDSDDDANEVVANEVAANEAAYDDELDGEVQDEDESSEADASEADASEAAHEAAYSDDDTESDYYDDELDNYDKKLGRFVALR